MTTTVVCLSACLVIVSGNHCCVFVCLSGHFLSLCNDFLFVFMHSFCMCSVCCDFVELHTIPLHLPYQSTGLKACVTEIFVTVCLSLPSFLYVCLSSSLSQFVSYTVHLFIHSFSHKTSCAVFTFLLDPCLTPSSR